MIHLNINLFKNIFFIYLKKKRMNSNKSNLEEEIKISSEKDNLNNNNNLLLNFPDLEMNTEFDENLYFTHFFNTFQHLEFENLTSESNPFLIEKEFNYGYFEEIKLIKEPIKLSVNAVTGHIKKFSNCQDKAFKKNFIDNIQIYSDSIGIENTNNLLIPALARIVDETLDLKIRFLKSLIPFIDSLSSNGDLGYNILKNNIMNIIDELYHPRTFEIEDEEMNNLLFENLLKVSKAIIPKDKGKDDMILKLILSFTSDLDNSSKHTDLCIKLIKNLCEDFGEKYSENYLLPQLNFFADDKRDNIRKNVLLALPNLCEIISSESIKTTVYNIIKILSNDLFWQIRKCCIEIIPSVLKSFKEKSVHNLNLVISGTNAKPFLEIIEKLISDNQKYVRNTIIKKIGEIICHLDRDELSLKLFDFYKDTIDEYYANKKQLIEISQNENSKKEINTKSFGIEELLYDYTYNFPAVLFCYGSSFWPKLRNLYLNLCNEKNTKIRRSIISSFHEVSTILGKELTENELLIIYDKFLESDEKTERNLALRNLPKILSNVNKETKEKYYKYFEAVSIFQNNNGNKVRNFNFINWKNKLDVAESILCYYNLYENEVIYHSIFPQCITFCLDSIYQVRKVASKVLGSLIVYLYNENYQKEKIIQLIETFSYHKKFQNRITFVKMCKIFLMNYHIYTEIIKNILIKLSNDKITNVRIAICKMLKKCILNDKCPCNNDETLYEICKKLYDKKSKSIVNIFQEVTKIKFDSLEDNENKFTETFSGDLKFIEKEFNIDINTI